MAKNKHLDDIKVNKVGEFLLKAYEYMQNKEKDILKDIEDKKEITSENQNKLDQAILTINSLYKEEYSSFSWENNKLIKRKKKRRIIGLKISMKVRNKFRLDKIYSNFNIPFN